MSRGAGSRGLSRDGGYDRGDAYVGAGDADFQALATLRTFRAKLTSSTFRPDQLTLIVDARPPEGGAIGGNDLVITPINLSIVSQAMALGGEAPIVLELVPPADWRSDTEIGRSGETVEQLLPRVSRAIDGVLARVRTQG